MKLPAIETPDVASDRAREWAYRIGTLAFDAKVDDVALVIQAAMDDAVNRANEAAASPRCLSSGEPALTGLDVLLPLD